MPSVIEFEGFDPSGALRLAIVEAIGQYPCTPNGGKLFQVRNPHSQPISTILQTDCAAQVVPWKVLKLNSGETAPLGCSVKVLAGGGLETYSFSVGGCMFGNSPRWPTATPEPYGNLAVGIDKGHTKAKWIVNRSTSSAIRIHYRSKAPGWNLEDVWILQPGGWQYGGPPGCIITFLAAGYWTSPSAYRTGSEQRIPPLNAPAQRVSSRKAEPPRKRLDESYATFMNGSSGKAYVRVEYPNGISHTNFTLEPSDSHSIFVGVDGYVDYCWSEESTPSYCEVPNIGRCYAGSMVTLS